MTPLCIAHRGASGVAPENTLAAFRRALEMKVDLIETDIRATADGEIVLLHDATVNRTTDGEGPLREWTLERLRTLDAGSWRGQEFAGERVPTLEEALALLRDRAVFLIEVKEPGLEDRLLDLLNRTDSLGQVVVQSFDAEVVRKLSQKEPRLSLGLLLSSAPQGDADTPGGAASTLHAVRNCGANFGGISGRMATPFMLDYLRTRGVSVFVWTLNEPEHLRSAIEAGVTGIISDYPERIPPLL